MEKIESPYIYTLKAILDQNEIYDSGDCDMIRHHARKDMDEKTKYITYDEYLKLEKKLKEIKLEAVLESMMAIYEGSADWNKGYQAGAADMIIRISRELFPEKTSP